MNWVSWGSGMLASAAAASLALFWYLAWSYHWQRLRLNMAAEWSLLLAIVFIGLWGVTWVAAHHP